MKENLTKLAKGAALAAAGAALVYLGEWSSGCCAGEWGPALAAGFAVLLNLVRKASERLAQIEGEEDGHEDD